MIDQFEFLFFFLPAVVYVFDRGGRTRWLLAASLAFYAVAGWRHLPELVASIAVNFAIGRRLSARPSTGLFWAGVAVNLGPLVAWKVLAPAIAPPGLSYWTFTQVAYLADALAGRTREDDPARYALFVTFFPAVLSGPIARHADLSRELARADASPALHAAGVGRFLLGFFQKCFVADALAPLAARVFDSALPLPADVTANGLLAYTFQIYFDFAGYSNMAIGVALAFGVVLPENFDRPYLATSIAEFWRRWHISLSAWLRDYVYLPLTIVLGDLPPLATGALASVFTMALCGLWHGVSWLFLAWGLGHGLLLAAHQAWRSRLDARQRRALAASRAFGFVSWLATFLAVTALWVPFRARDTAACARIAAGLSTFARPSDSAGKLLVAGAALLVVLPWPRLDLTRLEAYLFTWRRRSVQFALPAYAVLVVLLAAFYTTRLDLAVLRRLPVITRTGGIAHEEGDFRANLLANELFQGDERKVVICGSSFAAEMGLYRFEAGGARYRSGTVGIAGNGLVNGLRSAMAAMTLGVDAVILGITPLNCGRITNDCVFPDQGMSGVERLGFAFPRRPLGEVEPVPLEPADVARLAVAYRSPEFFQLHGFLAALWPLAPRLRDPVRELDLSARAAFRRDLEDRIAGARRAPRPVADRANGRDETFHWRSRGILESLAAGGDVARALAALKREADARRVRLVVYHTPTTAEVYPPGFLAEFNAALARLTAGVRLEYLDLSALFPSDGAFMDDFVHPTYPARDYLHRYLAYALTGGRP